MTARKPHRQHEWIKISIAGREVEACGACGIVRRRDHANDAKECRGPVQIVLRKDGVTHGIQARIGS
jgi:hypothetical protein